MSTLLLYMFWAADQNVENPNILSATWAIWINEFARLCTQVCGHQWPFFNSVQRYGLPSIWTCHVLQTARISESPTERWHNGPTYQSHVDSELHPNAHRGNEDDHWNGTQLDAHQAHDTKELNSHHSKNKDLRKREGAAG